MIEPTETAVAQRVTPENFTIEVPVLSRWNADRDETLRDPARIAAGWPTARMVAVGTNGAIDADGDLPGWRPTTGDSPPVGAVLLGSVEGIDHWAITAPEVQGRTLRELGATLDDTDAGLVVTAVAMVNWHLRGGFCPTCGEPSVADPAGWTRSCGQGHQEFPRTDPAVIVLVHDGADRMVLARGPDWAPTRFSVLAGFSEAGESLEATVRREIGEEIGVDVTDIRYLGSQPWPFPRSLMVGFAARAAVGAGFAPQDGEIAEARWVSRDTVRRILRRSGWADRSGAADRTGTVDRTWTGDAGSPEDRHDADGIDLPASISIARRMIEGWARID